MNTTAKQYKIYLTIGIIALFAVIFSATYAIFRISATQSSENMISTLDCIDISITGNTDALSLTNSYPMNDAEGSTQLPYRFTVQNNCSTFVEYQIIMSVEQSSTITNKEYIKIDLDGLKSNKRVLLSELTEEPQPALTGYKNNYTLLSNSFNGEESHVYNFRMWLNGDNENIWTDESIKDQTLSVKLSIIGVTKTENPCAGGDCLGDKILAQGGGPTAIEAKGTPDFNVNNGTSGLYASADEYGTSYFYRGLKTELNNNLIWGGFQWKIVRINGDGSIRLLYNGTKAQFDTNGEVNNLGADTQIAGIHAWNETNYNDAKYVGYMYGGANGVESTSRHGSIPTAATYNQTNTNMKTILDNWYKINIFDKGLGSQVADNIFCNDRQLRSDPGVGGEATGPGYGNNDVDTMYASLYRLATLIIFKPTLKCGLKNDRFTTSADTILGNGALTYPVGLLTADEASMAGLVYGVSNNTNYLNTNQSWWSFSPGLMSSGGIAGGWVVDSSGYLEGYSMNAAIGARPSVSLISATRVSGTGSATDPFVVVTAPTLGESILAQENGPAVIEAKELVDFSEVSPEIIDILGYYEDYDTYSIPEGSDWYPSNNDKAVGTGYIFNSTTGKFNLTNYTLNNTYSSSHIDSYTCDDNEYENCNRILQIKTVSGNVITRITDIFSLPEYNIDSSTSGLHAAVDEYGTSYYYRGSMEHLKNNLIFGGFQWKIIRINGDETIRIIYNGTEDQFNVNGTMNTVGTDTEISSYKWNEEFNDAKYVGYMFGGANGVASTQRDGVTSTSATYNQTSSVIKQELDDWYSRNISGKTFENKIADNLFCNDRQLESELTGLPSGPGYGISDTGYAAYYRLVMLETPTLKCTQKNDRFTVSDTDTGNGALTYPIGLITADEMMMAGIAMWSDNVNNYLSTKNWYWTMTPAWTENNIAKNWRLLRDGYFHDHSVHSPGGVRPVMNLSSEIFVTGTGSVTDPFRAL